MKDIEWWLGNVAALERRHLDSPQSALKRCATFRKSDPID
jgi:hypothetical protein